MTGSALAGSIHSLNIVVVDGQDNVLTNSEVMSQKADGSMAKAALMPNGAHFIDGIGAKTLLEVGHELYGSSQTELLLPKGIADVHLKVYLEPGSMSVRVLNASAASLGSTGGGAQALGGPGGGGEDCDSATVIGGLPFSDAGSNLGAIDDYDEICPFNEPGSGDVVYSYAPASDEAVNISLCAGSDYDTKLFVYENVCGPYQGGNFIACNDDGCSSPNFPGGAFVSTLTGVPMTAGNTYYIVVDGWQGAEGNYTIDMESQGPPQDPCPPGGIDEMEPCGEDTNGGCNSTPPAFVEAGCETYCGTGWADGGTRDTDWYLISHGGGVITATLVSEFPGVCFILDGIQGCAPAVVGQIGCSDGAVPIADATADLPPGVYAVFVGAGDCAGGGIFEGIPCGGGNNDYGVTIQGNCVPLGTGACCFSDGSCTDDLTLPACGAAGGEYQGDGTTCDSVVCVPICGPGAGDCFSANGTPGCEDVECCNAVCAMDPFCCDVSWDGVCAGAALDLCGEPGACCFADGSCQFILPSECVAAGGAFQGQGVLCGDVVCPIIPDQCENAEPLDVPSTIMGSTVGAAVQDLGTCGTSILAPGAWYSVLGTGNTMTATTCGDFFDYDTKISVFCGTCDDLTCVDGNDDSCTGGASGLLSTVTWCSQFNAQYYILVHGFGGQSGAFELSVSDDGVSCTGGVECLPAGACCLADGTCVDGQTIEQCLAAGGSEAFWFPGETCSGDVSYPDSFSACENAFFDITATGNQLFLSDDAGENVGMEFNFNFYGDTSNSVWVTSNGYLTFSGDAITDFSNDQIPDPALPNNFIAPFWDDLDPGNDGSPATVHYETVGDAPNRVFIAQWTDVPEFPNEGANTFQALLYEDGSCIEFRYGEFTADTSGTDVTIGIENQDGTDGVQMNAALIVPGSCITICPTFGDPLDCPSGVLGSLIIKQGACPAPVNPNSNGVVPMALIGDENIDATQVVLDSLLLSRCDGQGGSVAPNNGPPGPGPHLVDINHPYAGELGCDGDGCSCNDDQYSDGILDLQMFFRTNDLYEAGILAGTTGEVVTVVLTGELADGTAFEAADCIRLVQPGTPPGLVALQGVNVKDAWIDVTPLDDTLDGGGFGSFTRTYPQGTVLSVSAAPAHQGKAFIGWRVDGRPIAKFQTIALIVVGESQTIEAIYADQSGSGFSVPDGMDMPTGDSPPSNPPSLMP